MTESGNRRRLLIFGAAILVMAVIAVFEITRSPDAPPPSPAAGPVRSAVAPSPTEVASAPQGSLHSHGDFRSAETYIADVQPIVARRCSQCHGAGDPIPLTVYGEVRPWSVAAGEVIQSEASFEVHMKGEKAAYPKRGELRALRNWIRGGGPRGKPTPTPSRRPIS